VKERIKRIQKLARRRVPQSTKEMAQETLTGNGRINHSKNEEMRPGKKNHTKRTRTAVRRKASKNLRAKKKTSTSGKRLGRGQTKSTKNLKPIPSRVKKNKICLGIGTSPERNLEMIYVLKKASGTNATMEGRQWELREQPCSGSSRAHRGGRANGASGGHTRTKRAGSRTLVRRRGKPTKGGGGHSSGGPKVGSENKSKKPRKA